MTTEEQDALVGRVIRESKAAEDTLQRLLVKAENAAQEIGKLAEAVRHRIQRAGLVGAPIMDSSSARMPGMEGLGAMRRSDGGIEQLQNFRRAVDLDFLAALDKEIGEAVA